MGYNTVAVLLNDYTHRFEKDGPLGQRIAESMRAYPGRRSGLDLNFGAGEIISCDHADGEQVVIVHGNTGSRVDDAQAVGWQGLGQMARCLERHGYKVTKPRRKKPTTPPGTGEAKHG